MEIILLEKIRNLGNLGDTVKVKAGYARNFLMPGGKAVQATAANREYFEKRRDELQKKADLSLAQAQERAAKLDAQTIVIEAQASDEGKLYGSVGLHEVKEALLAKGHEVSNREIIMSTGPIHSIGQYAIDIQVHSDVLAVVQLEIVSAK